jgi:hypothetical protein
MISPALSALSYVLPAMSLLAFVMVLMRRIRPALAVIRIAAGTSLGVFVMIICESGHLPVSGNFEKFHALTLMLWLYLLAGGSRAVSSVQQISTLLILATVTLLTGSLLFRGMGVSAHLLIYDMPSPLLFFYLRKASITFFIVAFSWCSSLLLTGENREEQLWRWLMTRRYLLLAATLFMGGEFFGSVWAVNGWGDPWRWSRGFFIAAAIFLISMLVLHLPGNITRSVRTRAITMLISLATIVMLYLL